jgi:hypothetical protein
MADFGSMFIKSRGQPIAYQGKTLVMADFFSTQGAIRFRLVMETCNGNPVREDSASGWAADRGAQHRTAKGFFRTSEDGLAPWRDLEPPGRWRQAVKVCLVFKDRRGKWQAGASKRNEGQFVIDGKVGSGRDGIVFWQSKDWDTVEFEIVGDGSVLEVRNAWDCGNGVVESWHNGAAMIVEELPNGRRYRCNDGFADEDFDDIVFRLERIG